jgi:hypothetical protein
MKKFVCPAVLLGCLMLEPAAPGLAQAMQEIGINRTLLSAQPPAVQEKTLEHIRTLGATWFRDGPSSGSPRGIANFVDEVRRAKQHHLKVLMIISMMDTDFDNPNALPGNGMTGRKREILPSMLPLASQMVQLPRVPDLEAQRTAMKEVSFLVGKWSGEARLLRGPAESVELLQTEDAQYKLDGLILVIEGIGRTKASGQPVLQAFGIISYDDESATYRMRAFNDGRFLETQVNLLEEGEGMTWGFVLGDIRTKTVLRINEDGEWTELAEIAIGSRPPKKFLELIVRPQK